MGINESQLRELLEKAGVKCGPTRNDAIPLIFSDRDKPLLVAVRYDGGIVQFRTLGMAYARANTHRPRLLTALLTSNTRYKVAKYAFDPSDGEVIAYIDLLIEDGRLHKSQVRRCVRAMDTVIKCRRRFEAIIETGDDPGDDESLSAQTYIRNLQELMLGADNRDEPSLPSFVEAADDDEDFVDNTEAKSLSDTFSGMLSDVESGEHNSN